MFCAISISCAASRATWAFARDKAIPFYTHFGKISMHPCFPDVPVNALVLSTTIQVLLGLIYLGSSTAFNAFVGVAVMCLGASYALPVAISLVQGRTEVADAPFGLGRAGVVVNAIAVAWVVFAIVLFSMPAVVPVTQVTMSACLLWRCGVADVRGERVWLDYASVVFVGFACISAVWYMMSAWAGCIPLWALLMMPYRWSIPLYRSTCPADRVGALRRAHVQGRLTDALVCFPISRIG